LTARRARAIVARHHFVLSRTMPLRRRRFIASSSYWSAMPALAALGGATLWAQPAAAELMDVVAAARRSIVPVGTYSATDNPRFGFRGTGFVIGDGLYVVTNAHVVDGSMPRRGAASGPVPGTTGTLIDAQSAVLLTTRGSDTGEVRLARVAAIDRQRDLALLRIEGAPLPALQLDAAAPREGQSIALMGFPIGGTLGFTPVTHRGIIAAVTSLAMPAPTSGQLDARAVARLREGNFEILQLDATAYPGNSGGPVLDVNTGRVVGIVNMVLVKDSRESALTQPTGISYAIPVRQLQSLVNETRGR
jgi:serine protease Do